MSLAAALKKGLETADTIGNWDPFAEDGKADKGPANTNATARATSPRPAPATVRRNPIAAVRDKAPEGARQDDGRGALARMAAEAPAAAEPQVKAAARPAGSAQQRVAARQAGLQQGRQKQPVQKPAQRANWLHDAVSGGRVNTAQYVRELDRFAAEENRRAVADVVMDVNQSEVEGVVRHAARIKGRYLAKLLDIGNKSKSGVMEAEVGELTRYRETYEELARGLEILKSAIEAGDISVSGTVRR